MPAKLLGRKAMDGARGHTHAALLDGAPINVAHDDIRSFLILRRSAEDNCARLMPWIAAIISHVIVANDIPWLEHGVSFAAVGHRVAAGVENAMRPLRSAADAARPQTAVHVALGLTGHHRGKDFQVRL